MDLRRGLLTFSERHRRANVAVNRLDGAIMGRRATAPVAPFKTKKLNAAGAVGLSYLSVCPAARGRSRACPRLCARVFTLELGWDNCPQRA